MSRVLSACRARFAPRLCRLASCAWGAGVGRHCDHAHCAAAGSAAEGSRQGGRLPCIVHAVFPWGGPSLARAATFCRPAIHQSCCFIPPAWHTPDLQRHPNSSPSPAKAAVASSRAAGRMPHPAAAAVQAGPTRPTWPGRQAGALPRGSSVGSCCTLSQALPRLWVHMPTGLPWSFSWLQDAALVLIDCLIPIPLVCQLHQQRSPPLPAGPVVS